MIHRHRQQCGDGQREGGGWVEVGKGGGNGDICGSINNKNKEKKRKRSTETNLVSYLTYVVSNCYA